MYKINIPYQGIFKSRPSTPKLAIYKGHFQISKAISLQLIHKCKPIPLHSYIPTYTPLINVVKCACPIFIGETFKKPPSNHIIFRYSPWVHYHQKNFYGHRRVAYSPPQPLLGFARLGVFPSLNLKQNTMLKFEVYQRQDRTELGTVAQLIGKGGKIKFIPKNLADDSKRVAVILEQKNGASAMVLCSETVSAGVRSKDITLQHIAGFTVTEQITKSGETINVITMPTGAGNLVEFALDNIKVTNYEPSAELVPEDLIAF